MCDQTLLVPIPDFLKDGYQDIFEEGAYGAGREFDLDPQGRQCFALDACIVPAVEALWAAGIRSTGCCCGHGSGHGVVSIEVPNGGDVERRDKQTQYFYRQISERQEMPLHEFRGSEFRESAQ
jgi:hypothetical protein